MRSHPEGIAVKTGFRPNNFWPKNPFFHLAQFPVEKAIFPFEHFPFGTTQNFCASAHALCSVPTAPSTCRSGVTSRFIPGLKATLLLQRKTSYTAFTRISALNSSSSRLKWPLTTPQVASDSFLSVRFDFFASHLPLESDEERSVATVSRADQSTGLLASPALSATLFCLLHLLANRFCLFHTVNGVIDAEVTQKDGANFARPLLGPLPIYCFPSNPNNPLSPPLPAVKINDAWFTVNRIASEPSTAGDSQNVEIERLLGSVSDLQFQLDSKDIEIKELKDRVDAKVSVTQDDGEQIAILKSEIETLKRRLTQAQSRKVSEVSTSTHLTRYQTINRPGTPEQNGTRSPSLVQSNGSIPPELTYRESVIDVSTIVKAKESTPRMMIPSHEAY